MQTKEYRTEDKSKWPAGAWKDEPDKVQWPDPETGLPCLINRGPHGAWCGYVGIPETHPWFGKSYSEAIGPCTEDCSEDSHWSHGIDSIVKVHGGLTFSDVCHPGKTEATGVCHVPDPGESDHVWWFGFDCAHAGDLSPGYQRLFESAIPCPWNSSGFEEYRDMAYAKHQVTGLARQLAAHSAPAEHTK